MKRYIVLSVNDDMAYLYYVPLAVWSWRLIGWEPIIMFRGEWTKVADLAFENFAGTIINVPKIKGYRDDTITQVSRLYGAMFHPFEHIEDWLNDDFLMTGDIDLIPLSDYWKVNRTVINIFGHDLTGHTHYPICFIGMPSKVWLEVMNLHPVYGDRLKNLAKIKLDLDSMPQAKDPDFFKFWFTDQDLITDRINKSVFYKNITDRGKLPNGLAKGRVDRGSWSLDHETFIDAHLHRDLYKAFQNPKHEHFQLYQNKWVQHMDLLATVWPNEDWTWFLSYTKQFAELAQ